MSQPLGGCPECGGDRPFEQVHAVAGECPDVPGGDCPEWACQACGAAPPRFPDTEASFEELHARIARTLDYLKGVPASALEGAETRDIKLPARGDRTLEFKGLEFLQHWAIPNVFFHVTTAYAILRHNGVELGKSDFLGGTR